MQFACSEYFKSQSVARQRYQPWIENLRDRVEGFSRGPMRPPPGDGMGQGQFQVQRAIRFSSAQGHSRLMGGTSRL